MSKLTFVIGCRYVLYSRASCLVLDKVIAYYTPLPFSVFLTVTVQLSIVLSLGGRSLGEGVKWVQLLLNE